MNPSTSIEHLLKLILDAYDTRKEIFDIPEKLFYRHWYHKTLYTEKYGKTLHNPIGLASGPLTQLAQNIITGWLCGARVIELKTIQPDANTQVLKPSIHIADVAIHTEATHEMEPEAAYEQFLNAWIIIHILHHKLFMGHKGPDSIGTIFVMSLGYTLTDIRSEKIQWFIEKMMNCNIEKHEKIKQLKSIYPAIEKIDIPDEISNAFTINTFPGCSAREIEYACKFLMIDKKLHPTVKLDPILMGYNSVQAILESENSFDIELSDEKIQESINYLDALKLIDNLQSTAREMELELTIKLSNGLMCKNPSRRIPSGAAHVYLTGNALHPIAVNLAAKMQSKYGGMLNMSFSGGADCFNIANLLMSGFSTVTVCTDLLKPGGYGRLHQYFQELATIFSNYQVKTIKELILKSASSYGVKESAAENLMNYAIKTLNDQAYKRNDNFGNSINGKQKLEKYDCISAPCSDVSPMQNDVSGICHYTAKNNPDKAFAAVLANNPLPAITGMAGPEKHHRHCTRLNYDHPVLMNELERFISEYEPTEEVLKPPVEKNKLEVAVIGGGPAGLSCAWFLNRFGFQVDVFEAEAQVGGMIAQTAPEFRLSNDAIQRDIQRIKNSGIKILANSHINKERYENIRENYDFTFIATGAVFPDYFDFQKDETEGIIDGVEFLKKNKTNRQLTPGLHYAVLGSNYIAADAARTAKRICGSEGSVTLITPEAFEKMTVDPSMLKAIEDEDIEIFDSAWVLEPVKNKSKIIGLKLAETEPAMKNNKVVPGFTLREESQQAFLFDIIISCPDRKSGNGFFNLKNIKKSTLTTATRVEDVYAGGAFTNTAGTLESAIGEGKLAALEIAAAAGISIPKNSFSISKNIPLQEIQLKRFHREKPLKTDILPPAERMNFEPVFRTIKPVKAIREANRCLHCDVICNVCVNVCPNKAIFPFEINPADLNVPTVVESDDKPYVSYESTLPIQQKHQVMVIADWCNNCGNCTSFCPKSGSPNLDKLRVHLNKKSFANELSGILLTKTEDHRMMTLKRNGNIFTLTEFWDAVIFENDDCNVIMEKKSLKIEQIDIFTNDDHKMVLPDLAEMKILFKAVKHLF